MFMTLLVIKAALIVFSSLATILSVIFMLSPESFNNIEEFLGMEVGGRAVFLTVLEGRVMFVHNWVLSNRFVLGPVLCILAAMNTRSAVSIPMPAPV